MFMFLFVFNLWANQRFYKQQANGVYIYSHIQKCKTVKSINRHHEIKLINVIACLFRALSRCLPEQEEVQIRV